MSPCFKKEEKKRNFPKLLMYPETKSIKIKNIQYLKHASLGSENMPGLSGGVEKSQRYTQCYMCKKRVRVRTYCVA